MASTRKHVLVKWSLGPDKGLFTVLDKNLIANWEKEWDTHTDEDFLKLKDVLVNWIIPGKKKSTVQKISAKIIAIGSKYNPIFY